MLLYLRTYNGKLAINKVSNALFVDKKLSRLEKESDSLHKMVMLIPTGASLSTIQTETLPSCAQ